MCALEFNQTNDRQKIKAGCLAAVHVTLYFRIYCSSTTADGVSPFSKVNSSFQFVFVRECLCVCTPVSACVRVPGSLC